MLLENTNGRKYPERITDGTVIDYNVENTGGYRGNAATNKATMSQRDYIDNKFLGKDNKNLDIVNRTTNHDSEYCNNLNTEYARLEITKENDEDMEVENKAINDIERNNKPSSSKSKVKSRSANILFLLLRIVTMINMFVRKWTWLLAIVSCVSALKEQKFAIEPQDQSALIGSRVTLPCRVVNKAGQLQWTKDDFGLGTHRHLTGYERYKMVGSDEEGDYSLDIEEVTLDDDAMYQCQVSSGPNGEPPIRSRYARLRVLVPPRPPRIQQGLVLQTIEDQDVDLECVSVGGRPPAEITWVDHEGRVLDRGLNYIVEPLSNGLFTARSKLHFRPKDLHDNQTITCQAQNTADRTYKSTSIQLQVQYAPSVKIRYKSGISRGIIQEGNTLVMGCQATANPNELTYKWYVNNEEIAGSTGQELVIRNVSRSYNEALIKCEVQNVVGKSADTKVLEVTYGPAFKQRPQNIEGDVGSTVTLTCVVDGHPQPIVTWLRYENERFVRVGKARSLNITVSPETAGLYWCRASSEHHQDIEASATVYLKGPPKIMSNGTQYGIEGDSVRIECVSFSVPKPEYVTWLFDGGEINSFHNQEYAFLEETLSDQMTKSTLIIRESQARHFGKYNCSVTNLYGTDSLEVHLIPEKSFPLIMIASGCVLTAVFFLIVMLIIMLCHRKARKDDVKKPDITDIGKLSVEQFKDSDRHSNISDLKLELRHVEGSCDINNSNAGSETELHTSLHLTTNLGLPLAGPVPLPDAGFDNELMKQYQRYSGDFNQAITNLNTKVHGQSNGYVPYVDYSRDYTPPGDSMTGSLTRSSESTFASHCGSLHRQASCGRLAGVIGPDVIPMANSAIFGAAVDVRYAATYGNPYLRGSGTVAYVPQLSPAHQLVKPGPPPYYSVRNSNLNLPATSGTSPSSTSSSRPVTSPLVSSSSTSSSAQPQVPKSSPQPASNLYVLPHTGSTSSQSTQITVKGNGKKAGTHV